MSDFDLNDAYSVSTPEDNRRLYANWATTYDSDFLATHGYVYHESVVAALLGRDRPEGVVADVGCGTGVVGIELRKQGVTPVDGIDLSTEMLAVAATKRAEDGTPIYRDLIAADLTKGVDVGSDNYAAIVSAGTFTHGHLGPQPIAELVRIAMPGAVLALGINAEHFQKAGFGSWLQRVSEAGLVTNVEIVESPIYDLDRYTAPDADTHGTTVSSVAVFEVPV